MIFHPVSVLCGTSKSYYRCVLFGSLLLIYITACVGGAAASTPPLTQNDSAVSNAPISADIIGDRGAPKEPRNNISERLFHQLWTYEPEGFVSNATTQSEMARNRTDRHFQSPPPVVERWNKKELDRLPTTLEDDESMVYPPRETAVNTTSRGWLEGYIALISISPSTRLHTAPDTTPHYVAKNGTLRAVGDYLYDHPETNTNFDCGEDCRYYYENPQSERKSVDFIGIVNTVSDSTTVQPLSIDYTGLTIGEQTVGLEAVYTAQIEKVTENLVCVDSSDDGCEEYEWQVVDRETITETLTTKTTTDVSRYNPAFGSDTFRFSDNDTAVTVFSSQPWNSINPPTDDIVRGIWRYYTARDISWDTLKYTNTEGETVNFHSPVKPLSVHAYPDATGPAVESQAGLPYENAQIENVVSSTPNEPDHNSPQLSDTITLGSVEGQYNESAQITVRYPSPAGESIPPKRYDEYRQCADRLVLDEHSNRPQICGVPEYTPDNLTVNGIVRGTNYSIDISNTDPTKVKQSRVNWSIINSTTGSQRIKISLDAVNREPVNQTVIIQDGPSGDQAKYIMRGEDVHDIIPMNETPPDPPIRATDVEPIDTTVAEEAYIMVNGQPFNTNASGELVVETPRQTTDIEYHPAPYWKAPSIATEPSNEYVTPQAEFGGFFGAIYTIILVAILLFIPLWFLDGILGTNWWPPWQDHKYWRD
jgi:hypothetical protein